MAADILVRSFPTEDEDLTDDQMQAILAQAAARLQQKQIAKLSEQEQKHYTFPRLETGTIARSYVSHKDGVAQLDPSRRLNEKDRKLSNQIRKVEDPVVVSKRKDEVRMRIFFYVYAYEEDNPNYFS